MKSMNNINIVSSIFSDAIYIVETGPRNWWEVRWEKPFPSIATLTRHDEQEQYTRLPAWIEVA